MGNCQPKGGRLSIYETETVNKKSRDSTDVLRQETIPEVMRDDAASDNQSCTTGNPEQVMKSPKAPPRATETLLAGNGDEKTTADPLSRTPTSETATLKSKPDGDEKTMEAPLSRTPTSETATQKSKPNGSEVLQEGAPRCPSSVHKRETEVRNSDFKRPTLRSTPSVNSSTPARSTVQWRANTRATLISSENVFENTPAKSVAAFRWDDKNAGLTVKSTPTVFENTPAKSAADFCCGRVAAILDTMEANMAPFSVRDTVKKFTNRKEFDDLKEKGFVSFTAKQYEDAYNFFSRAMKFYDKDPGLYSIRSATALRMENYPGAIEDAKMCIELSPEWFMGHCRLGLVLMRKGDVKAAITAFEKGLLLEPTDVTMQQGIAKAKAQDGTAETVIGIDLGTSKTCVGVWVDGRVEILSDEFGKSTVPSCVAFLDDGERLLGKRAVRQMEGNLERTIFGVKRLIGKKMTDAKVQEFVSHLPYKVTSGDQNQPLIPIDDALYTPEEISAMLLSKMKKMAEDKLGTSVKKAVIATPSHFNDAQRQATKAAGEIAGLDVVRIINEPTAAAIAYGVNRKDNSNVLIFDLGGGCFDVSLLHIEDGIFEVKATGGDTHLGGEDFDIAYVNFLVQAFKKKFQIDVAVDKTVMGHLKIAAELSKRDLSVNLSSTVTLSFMGKPYTVSVERFEFEEVNKKSFDQTISIVGQVLKDAKMDVRDVNEVVLVGSSTHIPKIQQMLQKFFHGKALCTSVNPDEAVAFGAAVQSAILGGVANEITDSLLLVEVTSLSLGLETEGNHMSAIIPRSTRIPCRRTEVYTTTVDMQTLLQVRIFEGERIRTDQNRLLGEFDIHGIEKGKKGMPRIAVTFALNNDGILNVSALDRRTGAKADCTISDACKGLSADEIKLKIAEAEQHRAQDAETEKKVELKADIQDMARKIDAKCDRKTQSVVENIMKGVDDSHAVAKFSVKNLEEKKRSLRQILSTFKA